MKLRGMYKVLFVGVMVIALIGCGKKDQPEATPAPTVTPSGVPEAIATPTVQEGPDVTPIEEDVPQTNPEDIGGEGMVDETAPDISGIQEATVGIPMVFTNGGGADYCVFTVKSIKASDMKIENMGDVTGQKVVVAEYSFENVASDDAILIDDMSFKMLADNSVGVPYFSPELKVAEPAGKGETSTGQIAFLVDENAKDVILMFKNETLDAQALFKDTI